MSDLDRFRQAAIDWAVTGNREAEYLATDLAGAVSAVILVEGVSDAAAIEALADVSGRDLDSERVCVVPMRGVTNFGKFLGALGPAGLGMRIAGLCDAGEERYFRRGLERAGAGPLERRESMAEIGFFLCVEDLEDELIRTLGPERVVQILDAHSDLRSFRTFQNQPAKRGSSIEVQLHRFLGTTSGRKERYAKILIEGLDFPRVPRPLAELLGFVG
jgi:hypothetical protein